MNRNAEHIFSLFIVAILISSLNVSSVCGFRESKPEFSSSSSTTTSNTDTCNHPNIDRNAIFNEYIIGFHQYLWSNQHHHFISSILHSSEGFTVIKRDNPSTKLFPSDFALIKIESQNILNALKKSDKIKFIIAQHKIQGNLQKFDPSSGPHDSKNSTQNCDKQETWPFFSKYNNSSRKLHWLLNNYQNNDDQQESSVVSGKRSTNWSMGNHFNAKPQSGFFFNKRRLCTQNSEITDKLQAHQLWEKGFTGSNIKVGVFDTGLRENHPAFRHVEQIINYTDEESAEDQINHGTLIAGLIASSANDCKGLAPDAKLYIFKVFTSNQVSYTSWFLDAFNFAIQIKIHVLNLSIGGPDYTDYPFVEKIWELSANNIIVISAIGNDGPLYGTLSNPGDLSDVIGVGGIDNNDRIASFSSRGMTTMEIAFGGYGRVKPDIVTYGDHIKGTARYGSCYTLSGTSVSSPIVTGVIALLASTIPEQARWYLLNPASVKQILHEGAEKLQNANMFEQGAGKLNLIASYKALLEYKPKVTLFPPNLDMTDCPYFWPYCSQPLYHSAQPLLVNITVLNGMGVTGKYLDDPKWIAGRNGNMLKVKFDYSHVLWPWSGWISVSIEVNELGRFFQGIAEGKIVATIVSPPLFSETEPRMNKIEFEVKIHVISPPMRQQRILWDQYHNIKYPPAYIPRDYLHIQDNVLDWNGDHPHTNFRDLYMHLRSKGYFVEILTKDFTQFDARKFGTLLIIDPEEDFTASEQLKLVEDVNKRGLSLIVMADWYSEKVLKKIDFLDENTGLVFTPITGGSNIPSLNALLEPFGIAFGDRIYEGEFEIPKQQNQISSLTSNDVQRVTYGSGTSIIRFPAGGKLFFTHLSDYTEHYLSKKNGNNNHRNQLDSKLVAIAGFTQPKGKGRIAVFGDTSCVDSACLYSGIECKQLLSIMDQFLSYTALGKVTDELSSRLEHLESDYFSDDILDVPMTCPNVQFFDYSKVPIALALTMNQTRLVTTTFSKRKRDAIFWSSKGMILSVFVMFSLVLFLLFMTMRRARSRTGQHTASPTTPIGSRKDIRTDHSHSV